jgi:surfeit locus 1 family protein
MTRAARPLRMTVRGLIGTGLVFAIAAICVRLGFWQLDRREQRQAVNEVLTARMDAPPIPIIGSLPDTAGLRFRLASAEGAWDGERSIVLPGRSYQGVPGAHVLTPLRLSTGSGILVNRGWMPAPDAATVDSTVLDIHGAARVEGLIEAFPGHEASLAQRAGTVTGTGSFRRVWYAIDETALRGQFPYRLLDISLRLMPSPDAPTYPVRLAAPAMDEGPHLGYAIQWFSFAAIALIGWGVMVVRSRGEELAS